MTFRGMRLLPDSSVISQSLVLIPTVLEAEQLNLPCSWSLCGVGPIVAAATTARRIALQQPARVLLVGIAGTYGDPLQPGMACDFDCVACYGVGLGDGDAHLDVGEIGFPQVGATESMSCGPGELPLEPLGRTESRLLLTCCSASQSNADRSRRLAAHPHAVAEDMEGFAVAWACRAAGIPLTIVRGISNWVGDRKPSEWKTGMALNAARKMVEEWWVR